MELLSAEQAKAMGGTVRHANITNYTKKTTDLIMGRINEVIAEGFESGGIAIEQYIEEWACEPAGWCTITVCAPSVELYTAVMNAVEDRFTRLGYTVNTNVLVDEEERYTEISW